MAGMEDGEMMLKRYKWLCFDFILKGRGNQSFFGGHS